MDMKHERPEFLGVRDIARALNVSVAQAYRLIHSGKVPGARVAGVVRVPRAAWQHWLNDQAEAALANCSAEARGQR